MNLITGSQNEAFLGARFLAAGRASRSLTDGDTRVPAKEAMQQQSGLLGMLTVVALLFFGSSPFAHAATINVTAGATDTLGTNGQCSLREAITNINNGATTFSDCAPTGAYGTGDTINLPAGTYTNAIPGAGEDSNATDDLDITKSLTINGAGAITTIIDGAALDRVFHVLSGTVTISGVTIQNGSTLSGLGHGIFNQGPGLTLTNCTVSSNTGVNTLSGGIAHIGGGTLTLNSSTVSGNSGATNGGGIYNNSIMTLNNS